MTPRKVTYSRRPNHAARAAHARGEKAFRTYDTSAIRPKKSKTPLIAAIVVLLIIIVAAVALFANASCAQANPNMVDEGQTVTVEIEDGSTVSSISQILYDAGLIERMSDFESAVNAQGAASSLKSGIYNFTGGMSNDDIVRSLVAGPSSTTAGLTIPEGATLDTIATLVEQAYGGSISADQFKDAASSTEPYVDDCPFLSESTTGSLEGFLFPKTYELLINATPEQVVRQMLSQYQDEINTLDYSYVENQGMTHYDALVLASIVEKEATDDTRTKVAAVFYNRLLNEGDPSYGTLGSDATTAYEVGDNLDSYDWSTESPYNTRVTKGLPPTPICSPSLDSLQAVCSPEPNFQDYYFFSFWPNEQGQIEYFFDKTYDEHQQTIANHS